MLQFCVLSSGSKANCTYVSDGETSVLVDCGLSALQVRQRLYMRGIDPTKISAIVVSHEHSDHIRGIKNLRKSLPLPVYCNRQTREIADVLSNLESAECIEFETGREFSIGTLSFKTFSISHDAADPVGFRIHSGNKALGIVTDLGEVSPEFSGMLGGLDALILEANHDLDMLWRCMYPWPIKERIASNVGHLSNETAAELLQSLFESDLEGRLRLIIAAHISENSNTPETALASFEKAWPHDINYPRPMFYAASVKEASPMFSLDFGLPEFSGLMAVGDI